MTQSDTARLDAQMAFLMEADRLKSVIRATRLADGSRPETSAEHSWQVALFALTLGDQAPAGCDIARVVAMLLIHDIVEVDAGDAPVFGDHDTAAIEAAERAAADRIFGLLPADQAASFRALWDEFEANETPDARFAKALDRFVTPNLNIANGGGSWIDYAVSWSTFRTRVGARVERGAPGLWAWIAPRARAVFDRLGR